MTDEMLAERTRLGSGAAFAALVERHGDAVYRIARNMCASSNDAEEVTRQTFLSAYRDIDSWPIGVKFRAWLYRIAVKMSLAGRQRAGRSPASWLEPLLPRFDAEGRMAASGGGWPELSDARPELTEVTGLLREALDCIDDDVRAAFVLSDLVELPAEDAAATLRIAPPVVRQRVHRARLMLRGFLDRLWSLQR